MFDVAPTPVLDPSAADMLVKLAVPIVLFVNEPVGVAAGFASESVTP